MHFHANNILNQFINYFKLTQNQVL